MGTVAVAGKSLLTPLGDEKATLEALFQSASGITESASKVPLRNNRVAKLRSADEFTSYGQLQRALALSVATEAITEADLQVEDAGVRFVFATSYGHLLDQPGSDRMSTWAKDCLRELGAQGEPVVIGTACSAGSDALGVGAALLQDENISAVVVVAVDLVTEGKRLAHSNLGTMSDEIPKPFDIHRSGMILGDGAAAAVLKRAADCANSFGELIGYGAANDAYGVTAPDPTGESVRLAVSRALEAAQADARDISIYYSHGTATRLNDELEASVVNDVFGCNEELFLYGSKGSLGHSLGACGLIEFLLLIKFLELQEIPEVVGHDDPIPAIAHRMPAKNKSRIQGNLGVSATLGFGGFNTALIARRGNK
ncbi:beta-ketoacyl synthase N-terminal-like domain-containing protein [Azorhizophilus paspali]|uniref:Beta-ketoacyl synthase N-terminal-like domain-containing protein n=1 Tax=Azorhizophilus paspali TaxID=69963 RepID=A0ABV6SGH9_AZOPA